MNMLKPYKNLFSSVAPVSRSTQEAVNVHLRSWRSLYRFVNVATVRELQIALESECRDRARPQMMRRIITRLATLERNRLYKLLNIKTK
jgi:hypothetical protein